MIPYIAIFITILLFSSIETFSKMLTGNVDPFLIAFLRFFISGLILLLIDLKKIKMVEKKDWKFLLSLAITGISLALGSFHLSINGLDASTGAVIFSLNPIFSSLFAGFILKETIQRNRVIGTIISFIGVYVVIFGFNKMNFTNIGSVLLMLGASIGFGLYIAGSKPFTKKYGTFFTTGFIFLSGSLPYLLFIKDFTIYKTETSVPILIYLSLITTGLAYSLYFYGLKRIPIIIGTSMFYLKPIFATIFAIILLRESPPYYFYIGVFTILTGMIFTIKKSKSKVT